MPSDLRIKICGLTELNGLEAAVREGANYIGFVHFPPSPRHIESEQARELALQVPAGIAKVALMVEPSDTQLDHFLDQVPLDMLQLHGVETPERVSEIRQRYGLPVMKAIGISTAADLSKIDLYAQVADQLLLDAKPPKGASRPGGNAVTFDWALLSGRRWSVPWMLAGGLTSDNVNEALRITGARQIDLSSAVESSPGIKDPQRIRDFIRVARS